MRNTKLLIHWILLVPLLFIVACATQPPLEQIISGERMIAQLPSDWEPVYQVINETVRLSDFVPKGQTAAKWKTKLSFEAHATQSLTIDPIDLLLNEAIEARNRCNFVQHFNIYSGYENGYETSVRLFLCGENAFSKQGEVKLVKVIRGNDFLHSIRLTRRLEPFDVNDPAFTDGEIASWSAFLKTMLICDDSQEHPCPESD
jgi:hypothetical protein